MNAIQLAKMFQSWLSEQAYLTGEKSDLDSVSISYLESDSETQNDILADFINHTHIAKTEWFDVIGERISSYAFSGLD